MKEQEKALVPVTGKFQAGLDRTLGYFGQDRFVCFYYEPRGEEVVWKDSRSFGFGTGAWFTFMETVKPVADGAGIDLGHDDSAGRHVLVIDRFKQGVYFAQRKMAEWFFNDIASFLPDVEGAAMKQAC